MRASRFLFPGIAMFVVVSCTLVNAQFTLSYSERNTDPASVGGQSFTPQDAGSFPTSQAFLTAMTFQTASAGNLANHPGGSAVYLDMYADAALSVYVGSSSTSQTWGADEGGATKTWNFDYLELDASETYYAMFSSDSVAGSFLALSAAANSSNPYGGGMMIYNTTPVGSYDTVFSATFATSAVPEPSAYAAVMGVAAGVMIWGRRRRR